MSDQSICQSGIFEGGVALYFGSVGLSMLFRVEKHPALAADIAVVLPVSVEGHLLSGLRTQLLDGPAIAL